MTMTYILTSLLIVAGFYLSWNIGANDVSNAMGTSVGSKALTLRKAVVLAAILEFSGAFFVGGTVSETLQQGIIQLDSFREDPTSLVIGMLSALLATSLWLQIASFFGWPVSTTHAIVGAILGFGWIIGGNQAVHWNEMLSIALSWVISPAISGVIAFIAFTFLQRKILYSLDPVSATKRLLPYLIAFVLFTFFSAVLFNGLTNLHLHLPFYLVFLIAFLIASTAFFITRWLIHRYEPKAFSHLSVEEQMATKEMSLNKALKHLSHLKMHLRGEPLHQIESTIENLNQVKSKLTPGKYNLDRHNSYAVVEQMFTYLQILSACFVAFAHGANDVANAIGPVSSVLEIISHPFDFATKVAVPTWLLAFGGIGIVIGLATWGWRVIETVGKKITELTPTRGFCAEFGAAFTILVASKLGFPISTTHCIVGAVLGVGLAKGLMAINLKVIKEIVLSWVITIPCSATTCIAIFYLMKACIGSNHL